MPVIKCVSCGVKLAVIDEKYESTIPCPECGGPVFAAKVDQSVIENQVEDWLADPAPPAQNVDNSKIVPYREANHERFQRAIKEFVDFGNKESFDLIAYGGRRGFLEMFARFKPENGKWTDTSINALLWCCGPLARRGFVPTPEISEKLLDVYSTLTSRRRPDSDFYSTLTPRPRAPKASGLLGLVRCGGEQSIPLLVAELSKVYPKIGIHAFLDCMVPAMRPILETLELMGWRPSTTSEKLSRAIALRDIEELRAINGQYALCADLLASYVRPNNGALRRDEALWFLLWRHRAKSLPMIASFKLKNIVHRFYGFVHDSRLSQFDRESPYIARDLLDILLTKTLPDFNLDELHEILSIPDLVSSQHNLEPIEMFVLKSVAEREIDRRSQRPRSMKSNEEVESELPSFLRDDYELK